MPNDQRTEIEFKRDSYCGYFFSNKYIYRSEGQTDRVTDKVKDRERKADKKDRTRNTIPYQVVYHHRNREKQSQRVREKERYCMSS